MISVLILTKNEEQDLPGCLRSVNWSDDVHVYDSNSTDRTIEIAEASGARITRRPFDNWAAHQNWGIRNLPFRYPWVLYIDADERVGAALAANLRRAVENPRDKVAFRLRRRDFWGERWLKHVVASSYYMRLFRPEKMHYERLVNPVSIPDGPVGELDGYLDHYPFRKGMTHWLSRHNSYSSLEAQQIVLNRNFNRDLKLDCLARFRFNPLKAFFGKDRTERRFQQKELFYRLPARPLVKFLVLYIGKGGCLDGREGLNYALLQSFYESMIVLKTRELSGHHSSRRGTNNSARKALSEAPTQASGGTTTLKGLYAYFGFKH